MSKKAKRCSCCGRKIKKSIKHSIVLANPISEETEKQLFDAQAEFYRERYKRVASDFDTIHKFKKAGVALYCFRVLDI